MSSLAEFKNQFAQRSDLVHLNNAGLAPICRAARDRITYWAERFYQEGFYTDADYMAEVKASRGHLASLIGCQSDEIAWYQSTSGAINQFAFHCGLQPGDEVVMWDQEYSSHLYPWREACLQSGAQLVLVKSEPDLATPTEKYLSALTEKTKVAAFSWVQFQSGARMDVEAVIRHCKAKGILVFVDIMQGLGVHPCQIWNWGADAVAGGSHKWLVSPVGVGYLAIRKELAIKFKPRVFGAYTYGTCDDPSDFACEPKLDATKFEPGSKQVLEITALGAACQLISQVGVEIIEAEAMLRARQLRTTFVENGWTVHSPFGDSENKSVMTNVTPPAGQNLQLWSEKFKQHQINFAVRGPGLRFSTHAFNNQNDIDRIAAALV